MHTNLSISKTTRTEVCIITQPYLRTFADNNIPGNMHQVVTSNEQRSSLSWQLFDLQQKARLAAVRIQMELVEQGKEVPKTDAGKHLHGLLQGLVMKQGGMIEQLRNELVKSAGRDRAVIDALGKCFGERAFPSMFIFVCETAKFLVNSKEVKCTRKD